MKKSMRKKLFSLALSAVMTVTLTGVGEMQPSKAATDYGIQNPRINNGVTTWDKIKFGSYNQTAEFEAEPIKWRVLSVDGDDAFLLADQNLDCQPYNEEDAAVTWETCSLRKWLNKDFYEEAFNESERKAIQSTTVINEDNPEAGTEGGNDTTDKVYLLSIAEASNPNYGFDAEFNISSETREAKNTDYVKVKDAYTGYAGNGDWWLRSPGGNSEDASHVGDSGWGHNSGFVVYDCNNVVRPALHINLSSALYTDAGEVTSDGSVSHKDTAIQNPTTDANGVTTWDCVYFGNYKQTAKIKKEPIEWRVLSVDGDDAFLLADQNLECQPYNKENTDVTWEACSLRQWLNKDFYEAAFNESERKAIQSTTVINEDNPENETAGGNDTIDKVYLLSIAEASNPNYGFDAKFNTESETREAKNTDYAKVKDAYTGYAGNGDWWLRSPGGDSCYASDVGDDGFGYNKGDRVDYSDIGVRPALHINLSSAQWSKAGEVSVGSGNTEAEPTTTPTSEPTKSPEETANPTASPTVSPTQSPSTTVSSLPSEKTVTPKKNLKVMKLSSIKAKKNTKKITGKVSVSKAVVKIKVGKKAYKKATVKGKKFTLKVAKLKKKTKITIKVTKKGYRTLKKTVKVK